MLRNALFSLLILLVGKCYAQQNFFVLIQAEDSQPFYVKMGDKSLSSNAKGRLILSQLKDGSHNVTIGSPKQVFPEQQYTFNIDGKDLEFQLKDLGEKGWGLFNPLSLELKTADKKEVRTTAHNEGVKKDDAFSRLMAGVVGDTAVMYNTYAMEEVLKDSPVVRSPAPAVTTPAVTRTDSPTTVPSPPVSAQTDSATAPPTTAGIKSGAHPSAASSAGTVVKLSERKTPKGLRIAFADRPRGRKADTVIIIIPMDTVSTGAVAQHKPDSGEVQPAVAGMHPHNKPDSNGTISAAKELPGGKADSNGALYRKSTDLISSGAEKKTDSITPSTETVIRSNPDTIHVYINAGKKSDSTPAAISSEKTIRSKPDTAPAVVSPEKAARNKPDSSHNPPVSAHGLPATGRELYRSKPDSSQKDAGSKLVVVNSDCRNFASDYDVDKLRVKMLEGSKDEERILIAKKVFKTKCFTTKQIRALSEVFTTDAGKYHFFEAAYPFVSDDRFRELVDLLADPVYNGKFRAMTGQQ